MGYYSDFDIVDFKTIKLPKDFVPNIVNETNEEEQDKLKKRITELSKLSEDEMTVKQFKELNNLKEQIRNIKNDTIKDIETTNKYGFKVIISNTHLRNDRSCDDNDFICIGNYLYTPSSEGEFITFKLIDNEYVLTDLGYTQSNYGWVEEKIEELIKLFALTTTILDCGDEEYGFENEEGCERELNHKHYKNGVLL